MSTLQTKSGLPQNMNNQEIEKNEGCVWCLLNCANVYYYVGAYLTNRKGSTIPNLGHVFISRVYFLSTHIVFYAPQVSSAKKLRGEQLGTLSFNH
jgi:hypothetical protein